MSELPSHKKDNTTKFRITNIFLNMEGGTLGDRIPATLDFGEDLDTILFFFSKNIELIFT